MTEAASHKCGVQTLKALADKLDVSISTVAKGKRNGFITREANGCSIWLAREGNVIHWRARQELNL